MRHKMREYNDIRHDYINECRIQYGYGPRTKAEIFTSSSTAGLTSAMFGGLVTIALYAMLNPQGFDMMLYEISQFSTIQFLDGVFSPLRGLFLDPWSNVF